jgi:hypothetical protein
VNRFHISGDVSHSQAFDPATLFAPGFCKQSSLGNRGRRECRMLSRTRSLACKTKKHTSKFTTGTPKRSGIPCAMVLTVSFALSPETGLSCLRHWRDVKTSSPTWHQRRDARTTRLRRPLSVAFVFSREKRPPHPVPNVRDGRETPLFKERRMARSLPVIWVGDQSRRLRQINTTGKSLRARKTCQVGSWCRLSHVIDPAITRRRGPDGLRADSPPSWPGLSRP